MHPIGVAAGFAILRLHQEQLEVIGCSQVLRDPCLTDGFLPEDRSDLPAQSIPALLVIVHNRTVKIPFQFLKGHGSGLGRCFGIVNAVGCVGESLFKTFRHPSEKILHGAFC